MREIASKKEENRDWGFVEDGKCSRQGGSGIKVNK